MLAIQRFLHLDAEGMFVQVMHSLEGCKNMEKLAAETQGTYLNLCSIWLISIIQKQIDIPNHAYKQEACTIHVSLGAFLACAKEAKPGSKLVARHSTLSRQLPVFT